MATYKKITATVMETDNFMPKNCWIAHVMSKHGLTKRQAYNRISPAKRKVPCPMKKWSAIEKALRYHKMI